MKYLLTGTLCLFAAQLFSQTYPPQKWQEGKKNAGWIEPPKSVIQPKTVFILPGIGVERMPVQVTENKGIFKGNNGRGFDVYSMKVDNMLCLVPDSSFQSRLPAAPSSRKQSLQKP